MHKKSNSSARDPTEGKRRVAKQEIEESGHRLATASTKQLELTSALVCTLTTWSVLSVTWSASRGGDEKRAQKPLTVNFMIQERLTSSQTMAGRFIWTLANY